MENKNLTCCTTECEKPLDKTYWNKQWENQQTGWDIGFPSPAITAYVDQIADKTASILIPGCGSAYEAAYLVEQGFSDITLIDIAPVAVQKLQEKFKDHAAITILCGDFFEHTGQYDYIIEQTFFCALPPTMRPKYVWKMHQLLKPTGRLVGLLFNRHFEQNPPFGGSKEEYENLFFGSFSWDQLETSSLSIQPRSGSELFINFQKNEKHLVELYAFTGLTCTNCVEKVTSLLKAIPTVLQVVFSTNFSELIIVSSAPIDIKVLEQAIAYDEMYRIQKFVPR